MGRRRCRGAIEMTHDGRHGALKLQNQTRIDDVLARGAPVHVSGGLTVDSFNCVRQLTNERDGKVPVACRRCRDCAEIELSACAAAWMIARA
jgi:hypothetical protein